MISEPQSLHGSHLKQLLIIFISYRKVVNVVIDVLFRVQIKSVCERACANVVPFDPIHTSAYHMKDEMTVLRNVSEKKPG